MPLGNLTSQFFANVYLDELDQFVKHELKAKYYIRYVDDFVILHNSKKILADFKKKIGDFLKNKLIVELHPNKSYIIELDNGITFLGLRIFFYHKLIKKSNIGKFEAKLLQFQLDYKHGIISKDKALDSIEGWLAYISHANTYKYRNDLILFFNKCFAVEQNQTVNNKKHKNFIKKVKITRYPFSSQKTLQFYKKELSIKDIAKQRNIKESTVWEHLAKLVEYNQLPVWKVLPKEKIGKILSAIRAADDKLKDIKCRLNNTAITFDEINCVLAHYKNNNRKKSC
ncbi:MAG TPA: helix-turn-helix domain-containing protein [Candidatus Nanoarchaeia archaeon]|nr:helix-turn-helix domain-containing protein [Candidatus Nanoarchaeia archaeon]